jgi:hypothetical protein
MDLLSQYNTPISGGTGQTIGHGTFDGQFMIVPSAANNGSTIDDTQIQSELLAQINAGHLPAPILDAAGNVNTIYMIYFPPGKTILLNGRTSCVGGGFCAYHYTTSNTFNLKHILYGVHPDMQSGNGCFTGCGSSGVFGNYTSITSHELAEAITDADVGLTTTIGFPLAWYDKTNNQEIGDLCFTQQGSYTANGTTYTIQLEFSNAASGCVLPSEPDFSLSESPIGLTLRQGSSGSSTITVTPSGGFTGSVSLSASGLPGGVTASFGTNPTTSTGMLTLTANSTATIGTSTVTITGTSGTLTHTTALTLTINGNPSVNIAWIKPSALSWGPANTLTAAGFANGGTGDVALWWRDATLNGPWNSVAYQAPTDPNNGGWSNTIPSADTCHTFQATVQYSGISASNGYDGVAQGYCSFRVIWIQPQSTAGFGPPGSLVVAGSAQGGPTNSQVTLWFRDDTAQSAWTPLSYAPIPDSTGTWYNSIPSVDYTHQYSVYITFDDVSSSHCSYFGNGSATTCP